MVNGIEKRLSQKFGNIKVLIARVQELKILIITLWHSSKTNQIT